MKVNIFFLLLIFIFFNCEGKKNKYVESISVVNYAVEENVSNKELSLKEQIENYDEDAVFLFMEEGNFTNSGNIEILAFFQFKSTLSFNGIENHSIDKVYCFILDEINQAILRVVDLRYATGPILSKAYLDDMPLSALGREIRWLNRRFGFIGDFNNNGKEELYFFESSSLGVDPCFFEFNENEFEDILPNYEYYTIFNLINMNISNVNTENKTITFKNKKGVIPDKTISLAWNNEKKLYEEQKDLD